MATWNLFVLCDNETNYYGQSFISKSFNITRKPAFVAFAHFGEHGKSRLTQSIVYTK